MVKKSFANHLKERSQNSFARSRQSFKNKSNIKYKLNENKMFNLRVISDSYRSGITKNISELKKSLKESLVKKNLNNLINPIEAWFSTFSDIANLKVKLTHRHNLSQSEKKMKDFLKESGYCLAMQKELDERYDSLFLLAEEFESDLSTLSDNFPQSD